MGIVTFKDLLTYLFSGKQNLRGLSEFRGHIAVVDGSHRLLKQCIGRISKGEIMKNSSGKEIIHLLVTFITLIGMLDYGIQPLHVFEGKSPGEKTQTCEERRTVREKARRKCEEIEDKTSAEYIKNLKKSFCLSNVQMDEVKKLLYLAGIPYVESECEGDQQCAAISKRYDLPVITDDTDILAYGGSRIWKDFSLPDKSTHEIRRHAILDKMRTKANEIRSETNCSQFDEFPHEKFVDFCIMLGTDYRANNSKTNSCKTQLTGCENTELFRIFVVNDLDVTKTCEYIIENCSHIRISRDFLDNWTTIRDIYLNAPVENPDNIQILMHEPQIDKLVEFLCDENGLDRNFIESKVGGLYKNYEVFNNVYKGVSHGEEDSFSSFRSYRLKHEMKKDKIRVARPLVFDDMMAKKQIKTKQPETPVRCIPARNPYVDTPVRCNPARNPYADTRNYVHKMLNVVPLTYLQVI
jgi:5'-3' exonuclease